MKKYIELSQSFKYLVPQLYQAMNYILCTAKFITSEEYNKKTNSILQHGSFQRNFH